MDTLNFIPESGNLANSKIEDKNREEIILEWIDKNLARDPLWIEKDHYLDVPGGDEQFFNKLRESVESRKEGVSFYYQKMGSSPNKWRVGVVKKHQYV